MITNKKQVLIYLTFIFFLCYFLIPNNTKAAPVAIATPVISCDSNIDGKTDQELQAILNQCDKDIAAQQAILDQNQKDQVSLKQGISDLTANINKTQLEINAKKAEVKQLGDNITVKTQYINELSNRMDDIKKSIGKILRETPTFSLSILPHQVLS